MDDPFYYLIEYIVQIFSDPVLRPVRRIYLRWGIVIFFSLLIFLCFVLGVVVIFSDFSIV